MLRDIIWLYIAYLCDKLPSDFSTSWRLEVWANSEILCSDNLSFAYICGGIMDGVVCEELLFIY